ncbi:hypothetical protein FIC94_22160, partial [Ochrobactrum teleogrylli]
MTEGEHKMTIRLERQMAKQVGAIAREEARRGVVLGDLQRVLLRGASVMALSVAIASGLALPQATNPAKADDLIGYHGGAWGKGSARNHTEEGGLGNGMGGYSLSLGASNVVTPIHGSAINGVGADGWGIIDGTTKNPVYGGIGGKVGGTSVGSGAMTISGFAGGNGSKVTALATSTYSTGGGGGGAGLFLNGGTGSTLTAGSSVIGGVGGAGGGLTADDVAANPMYKLLDGGGGGGGGAGIILRGNGTSLANAQGSSITGGAGGAGGGLEQGLDPNILDPNGDLQYFVADGGGGGGGGDGIVVDDGASFTNLGTVTGGKGGAGGKASTYFKKDGFDGSDGAGIRIGSDTHVINNGTIAYGGDGHGSEYYDASAPNQKATEVVNAVEIVGDNNTFEIWGKSKITGNVVAAKGTKSNSLVLGGADDGTIDGGQLGGSAAYTDKTQYQGFASYTKDGTSTWTMTGVVA